jgi:hypothetical protein
MISRATANPRIVNGLHKGHTKENAEQFIPLFHQWSALTANLIAITQTTDHCGRQVDHVVKKFEELFASCRPRMSRSDTYRRELRELIHKAVAIDFKISSQTTRYLIDWPHPQRYDIAFNETKMQQDPPSPSSSRNVRFILQPCLFRGDGQGEGSDNLVLIDRCVVWMI